MIAVGRRPNQYTLANGADPRNSDPNRPWHGSTGGYSNHGCRCEPCATAWNASIRRRREQRVDERVLIDGRWVAVKEGLVHGKANTYSNYRCQCAPCLDAHSDQMWKMNRRRKLRKLGWPEDKIEEYLVAIPSPARIRMYLREQSMIDSEALSQAETLGQTDNETRTDTETQ